MGPALAMPAESWAWVSSSSLRNVSFTAYSNTSPNRVTGRVSSCTLQLILAALLVHFSKLAKSLYA